MRRTLACAPCRSPELVELGLQVELAVFDAFDECIPLAVRKRQSGLGGVFGIPNHHLLGGG